MCPFHILRVRPPKTDKKKQIEIEKECSEKQIIQEELDLPVR